MAIETIRCPVLGTPVTRVTDYEGNVVKVICGEYDSGTRSCRAKIGTRAGGPLSQLLVRVAEHTLDTPGTACVLMR